MYGELMIGSVAKVAGSRARDLRLGADVTLDQFSRAARNYGLPWSTGRVGDFEAGRAAANLSTLLIAAAALGDVIGRPVSLVELFAGDGDVAVNDRLAVDLSALRAALSGEPVRLQQADERPFFGAEWARDHGVGPSLYTRVYNMLRESDVRMCKRIGVSPDVGAALMAKLWGRTFSIERDQLAGDDANAQKRGQISRRLQAELEKVMEQTDNGDD